MAEDERLGGQLGFCSWTRTGASGLLIAADDSKQNWGQRARSRVFGCTGRVILRAKCLVP